MTECDSLARKNDLAKRLHRFIRSPFSSSFDDLSLEIFAHQFHQNLPHQKFARSLDRTPDSVTSWQEIPPVPTSAFKLPDHPLTCGDPIVKTFLTSGTTTEIRGAHHFPDLSFYELAIDYHWPLPNLPPIFLAPSARENPQSSLAHMFAHLNPGDHSRFLIRDSKFHLLPLFHELEKDHPIFLMGTALAFLHLMESHGPLPLPVGSQLLETGGYKGTSHTLSKPDFYQSLTTFFEIPPYNIHNEYGMTELSSQAYATGPDGSHRFPHWVRHQILDPETSRPLPPGQIGYLVIHDLANLHSVTKIQTQDFAIGHQDHTFTLIGRDPGAIPRGCSRTIDDALSS